MYLARRLLSLSVKTNRSIICRTFSTQKHEGGAVKLSYSSFLSTHALSSTYPLLIIHGMFGSKKNWNSIAKAISRTGRKVITVDARNHGESPHVYAMDYEAMAADCELLLHDLGIDKAAVLGHSMGGKVAISLALLKPEQVHKLISVDAAPIPRTLSQSVVPEYLMAMKDLNFDLSDSLSEVKRSAGNQLQKSIPPKLVAKLICADISPSPSPSMFTIPPIISAMKKVEVEQGLSWSRARHSAGLQLRQAVPDKMVREFILTNLVERDNSYTWRINLDSIEQNYNKLVGFPDFSTCFQGDTLFLGGANSDYISKDDIPEIRRLFPEATVQHIEGAGHWVHADKPIEFLRAVMDFLDD